MKKFWKSQKVGIKAAIISGFFVIIAGFCTVIAALITIYPDSIAADLKITETSAVAPGISSTPSSSSLVIERPRVLTSWELQAQIENQPVFLVPSECWIFSDGNLNRRVGYASSLEAISSFLAISSAALIIEDIQVLMDEYSSPTNVNSLNEIQVALGEYGGGVNAIDLGSIAMTPKFEMASLTPVEAYQLKSQDALRFYFNTRFLEPGQYKYHVSIEARTMKGDRVLVESEQFFFSWIITDNFTSKKIINPSTKNVVTVTSCD